MRYLTALPVFVLLIALDVLILVSVAMIAGVFVVTEMGSRYPTSARFAEGIWLK